MNDMGTQYLEMLKKASESFGLDISPFELTIMLVNSIVLGCILTALTYYSNAPIISLKNKLKGADKVKKKIKKQMEVFIASTNILFLCVGLTGVMLLVNNNLARALAIGATLGLVRFRVALGTKMIGSNMLFGIIAGIACGLNELFIAWAVTGIYIVLQSTIVFIMRKYKIDLSEQTKNTNEAKEDGPVSGIESDNFDDEEFFPGLEIEKEEEKKTNTPPSILQ